MIRWCDSNKEIPEGELDPFVVAYQINIDDDDPCNYPATLESTPNPLASVRFFVSSKFLLKLASDYCKLLQADATYKLNWHGYPVLMIGVSDDANVFHPFGIAMTIEEKSNDFSFIFRSLQIGIDICGYPRIVHCDLLADAADAITNGFEKAFRLDKSEYKRGKKRNQPIKIINTHK